MYLTFEEYQANGGTVTLAAYPLLERLAEKKLDHWTFNRIAENSDDIKLAMTLIVNALDGMQGDKVASFSNNGISVNFENTDDIQVLYRQIVEILPYNLVYLGVG